MITLEDIENLKVEKRKELIALLRHKETVELEILSLSRQILDLQIKRKDLYIPLEKAKTSEKTLRLEIKNLEEKYWSLRT